MEHSSLCGCCAVADPSNLDSFKFRQEQGPMPRKLDMVDGIVCEIGNRHCVVFDLYIQYLCSSDYTTAAEENQDGSR